ncbi:ribonuclease H-like domain-containing protein [Tanacetum coccineum]
MDDLKLKLENQINESELVYSVFNSRESDVDNSPVNDRFKIGEGFHAVPPPYTGNYMPLRPDLSFDGLDDSVYKTKESTHKQVEYPRKSQSPRGNRRNWNGLMTEELGNGFESIKKACFVCESFNHLIKDYDFHDNKMVEKLVLNNKGRVTGQREIRPSGQVPVNAAKQNSPRAATSISTARSVNTAVPKSKVNVALPKTYSYFKVHSPVRRAFNKKSAAKIYNLNEKVKTAKRPTGNVIDHTSKDSGSYMLKRFDYVDLQGRLKHMTGNKSFLIDYQEIDGGFVAFGGSSKELKFNLFSVSQMCDKKNSILFTETECLVLSPDFKLLDESQVLLKVSRQNNMYSFDLKNVVPSGGLTCLFAKATIDESNLWHRRLGHINFKTMNKLVRGNLVRGLPSKLFENDHTCVACQKGKQHKASCIKDNVYAVPTQQYILLPLLYDSPQSSEDAVADDAGKKTNEEPANFWQTASASTSENGEMEITATIDGRVKTITPASIKRHLKLEDSDGIITLPNTEIFEQLALMSMCPILTD